MEATDANRKRPSDQVAGSSVPKAALGLELVVAAKADGGTVLVNPPPEQDPKRSKLMGQLDKGGNLTEKTSTIIVKKTPNGGKGSDARSTASATEDRRTQ